MFRVQCIRFRIQRIRFRVQRIRFRVQCIKFRGQRPREGWTAPNPSDSSREDMACTVLYVPYSLATGGVGCGLETSRRLDDAESERFIERGYPREMVRHGRCMHPRHAPEILFLRVEG